MSSIRKDDMEVLRFAGLMGHEYAGVATRRGRRRLVAETNSAERAEVEVAPGDEDAAIYRRLTKGGWELVSAGPFQP